MTRAIVNDNSSPLIIATPRDTRVVAIVGSQGPPGADGDAASRTITVTAGETLGGHRAVLLDSSSQARYTDSSSVADAGRVVGLTTGSASAAAAVTIQISGDMTEPSWSWTPGAILYLGANGQLTETAPSTGFIQAVAHAVTATKIILEIHQPIML